MTPIEAVARAICRERGGPACSCRDDGDQCRAPLEGLLHHCNPTKYQTEGVLSALAECEPTPAMFTAGQSVILRQGHQACNAQVDCEAVFRAMMRAMKEG